MKAWDFDGQAVHSVELAVRGQCIPAALQQGSVPKYGPKEAGKSGRKWVESWGKRHAANAKKTEMPMTSPL